MTTKQGDYGGRKVREGTVVSDKMQKTVLVAVEANFRHRLYKKTVRRVRRLMAHDESEDAQMGDRVRIVEASPISRHKRWRVVQVLSRAQLPDVAPESIDLELLGEVKREETVASVAAPAANGASDVGTVANAEAVSIPEPEVVVPDEIEIEEAVQSPTEGEAPADEEPVAEEEATPDQPVIAAELESAEAASRSEAIVEDEPEPEVVDEAEIEPVDIDAEGEDESPIRDASAEDAPVEGEAAAAATPEDEEESA
jgi:small subunit ribosomal protein S17